MEPRAIAGQYRSMRKDGDESIYTFVASTSDPDRHRTVLNQDNWDIEHYKVNPIIGYQHNLYGDMCNAPDPDDVVGKSVKTYFDEGQLMIDIAFDQENEKAIKIESKVARGFLSTVSVGFIEKGKGSMGDKDKDQDVELYYFAGQELLEVSIVNIPSNPKAAKKSIRSQTFDAFKYIYRMLDGKYRFSEIENMKIKDVLDLLDGEKEIKIKEVKKLLPPIRSYRYKGEIIHEIK